VANAGKSRRKTPKTIQGGAGSSPPSANAWELTPAIVRQFLERRPDYEQLASEVSYTMKKVLSDAAIKVAAILHRAKDLNSFLEKIDRKSYSDPFKEISDFSGVRIVCYYADSIPTIESLIRGHFKVIEQEDKTLAAGTDRFGYGGTHLLVQMDDSVAGARYDDLKGLACEVQVRTVMQDAWSILSHHLVYKRENDIPDPLKRQVNALAGSLDSVDFAFQAIRDHRDEYIKTVSKATAKNELLDIKIDADSLREFVLKRFPDVKDDRADGYFRSPNYVSRLIERLTKAGYSTLLQLDDLLKRTAKAREWFSKNNPGREHVAGMGELSRAILLAEPSIRTGISDSWLPIYEEGRKLVEARAASGTGGRTQDQSR
jgi:putative GTP pyrophosphokinase